MSGFSSGTIQAQREWCDVLEGEKKKILRNLDLAKLPFKIKKE